MENNELLKRGEDLARRCENKCIVTNTGFLSPAERYALEHDVNLRLSRMIFRGGHEDAERTMCFFLPEYMEEEDFDEREYICVIKITAAFGEPGHRDYMGAVLGMGVDRAWVGDIITHGQTAYVLCQPSVLRHLESIDKVGRYGVKAGRIELCDIPHKEKKMQEMNFTVMSLRLDAVCAGMFRLSRTEAARQIAAGNVSLNYSQCLKSDATVREGDIVSLRGGGKGKLSELGGNSKKGRLFVTCEVYK